MKKTLFLILVTLSLSAFAQKPYSYTNSVSDLPSLKTHQLPALDWDKIALEDNQVMEEKGIENVGRVLDDQLSMNNAGTTTTLVNGAKIWRFKFKSEGAEGTCVYFDNFYIPEGGRLYLYSSDQSYFVGPIGAEENNEHGLYVTDLVPSDEAILEYYQPADVVGNARFNITGFGHFYQGVYEKFDKGSEACEVNVNCPEGDGWEDQRDAVVRLTITSNGQLFYCSGAMVNNTAQDCKQYLLTALHCVDGVSDNDFLLLKTRFNYERANCVDGGTITSHNRTGVFHRANSNGGGGVNGSDYALLEVEDEINSNWDTYYAGWDSGSGTSSSGVGIHHPAGDRKKISTFTSNLLSATYQNAFGAHWRVTWVETETNHGVTEGGSSGSPIFNSDKQIVGTLTGGASYCDAPNDPDFYGKMSYHFNGNNPNTTSQKLKAWLDPINTGQTTLDGLDCNSVDIEEIKFDEISIYPNPTTDRVTIEFSNQKIDNIKVFNSLGKLVLNQKINGSSYEFNMESFPRGVYYLTFTSNKKYQLTKKITKI